MTGTRPAKSVRLAQSVFRVARVLPAHLTLQVQDRLAMAMLTISQPSRTDFGLRPSNDYHPSYSTPRYSPKPSFDQHRPELAVPASGPHTMSTSHRGLPPPSAMTLPDPGRPPVVSSQPGYGSMPAPPSQYQQGADESMRNWLSAKAEEERRLAEEAKIQQEALRLEQRRVEQAMLRESMQGGVPPQMIPMIFAGIGGANLANASLDWLQQYSAQLHASQQQVHQQVQQGDVPPELRREKRTINPQGAYGPPQAAQQPPILSAPPPPPPLLAQHQPSFATHPPPSRSPPGSTRHMPAGQPPIPRTAAHAALPRLTTNEMSQHAPPAALGTTHPLHQTQTVQSEQSASSPSIYFHHWVPPAQDSKPTQPPTPSGRNEPQSGPAQAVESEYTSSPRKRKAQGGHQPIPPPPSYTSPTFSAASHGRRGAHSRSASKASKDSQEYPRHTPNRRDSGATRGPQADSRSRDSSQRPGAYSGGMPASPAR